LVEQARGFFPGWAPERGFTGLVAEGHGTRAPMAQGGGEYWIKDQILSSKLAWFLRQMPARIPRLFFIILFSSQRIKKPPLCSITNPRSNGKDIGGFSLVFAVFATRQQAAHLGGILRV